MRPNLRELCGIDPQELKLLPHYEAEQRIIDACFDARDNLAEKINLIHKGEICGSLSRANFEYMYLDKAISGRVQDYELMGLTYKREEMAKPIPETDREQVGGSHYQLPIEPIDFIVKNDLGYREGNVIKYVVRHQRKNGKEDIKKAIHYLEMILEDYNDNK